MAPKLSLYASLLDPKSKAAEESAQELEAGSKKQSVNTAALRFQPTKRPQINSQKPKPKPAFSKASSGPPTSSSPNKLPMPAAQPTTKTTLADWTVDEDDVNGFYTAEKRQRGGRKKRKKNKEEPVVQDWDDLYDPTRPNNYDEYKQSDERIREIREWKDLLYSHRMARRRSSDQSTDDERPKRSMNAQFAPPPSYNFAPPPSFEPSSKPTDLPTAGLSKDESGEDAFTRRMRLSQIQQEPPPSPPPPPPTASVLVGTISRAPVRYNFPAAPAEIPASEEELEQALQRGDDLEDSGEPMETDERAPRSNRPGQKGFAERLMAKYGWTKGSGLGASSDGITTALKVKVEKVKKGPNAEKGGPSGGRGKIIGGKRKGGEEEGKFGAMSEVVLLKGMVDGLDLNVELGSEGTLVQEIGEECGEKYGRVERVFVHRSSSEESIPVFIQFTSQLSALRAVNALDGRIFNGNTIQARFFDPGKFEKGDYE